MNPICTESKRQYIRKKQVCDKYEKGLCGFCKHCDKLSSTHFDKLLDDNWIVLEKLY